MDPAVNRAAHPLAPALQLGYYAFWLRVEIALPYPLTYPWAPEAWREVRHRILWLLVLSGIGLRAGGVVQLSASMRGTAATCLGLFVRLLADSRYQSLPTFPSRRRAGSLRHFDEGGVGRAIAGKRDGDALFLGLETQARRVGPAAREGIPVASRIPASEGTSQKLDELLAPGRGRRRRSRRTTQARGAQEERLEFGIKDTLIRLADGLIADLAHALDRAFTGA